MTKVILVYYNSVIWLLYDSFVPGTTLIHVHQYHLPKPSSSLLFLCVVCIVVIIVIIGSCCSSNGLVVHSILVVPCEDDIIETKSEFLFVYFTYARSITLIVVFTIYISIVVAVILCILCCSPPFCHNSVNVPVIIIFAVSIIVACFFLMILAFMVVGLFFIDWSFVVFVLVIVGLFFIIDHVIIWLVHVVCFVCPTIVVIIICIVMFLLVYLLLVLWSFPCTYSLFHGYMYHGWLLSIRERNHEYYFHCSCRIMGMQLQLISNYWVGIVAFNRSCFCLSRWWMS